MRCGFFEHGRCGLNGKIGPLRLAWDRSGQLAVSHDRSTLGLQFAVAGSVVAPDGSMRTLAQAHEQNPQWIFVEEGPQRIALRVRYRLYDEKGNYHGDGLHNVFAYADGDLFMAFAVAFADQAAHRCIADAWLSARPTGTEDVRGGPQILDSRSA